MYTEVKGNTVPAICVADKVPRRKTASHGTQRYFHPHMYYIYSFCFSKIEKHNRHCLRGE